MTHFHRIITAGAFGLMTVAGAASCSHFRDSHGYVDVEVRGRDGYNHRGYYDRDNHWNGGWYDNDRRWHRDGRDWRHDR